MKLPVTYPIITSFTKHANLFSVLSGTKNYYEWFLNNYIQLWFRTDNNILDFYMPFMPQLCPLLYCQKLSREFMNISLKINIKDFLINCINEKYYVSIVLDEYFIPISPFFKKRHHPHEVLIYGYNCKLNLFYIADFFKNRKYSYSQAPFNLIEKAYYSVKQQDDYLNAIHLYKHNEEAKFDLSITNIKKGIGNFLNSVNPSYQFSNYEQPKNDGWIFGKNIYSYIKDYLIRRGEAGKQVDARIYHVLYDHKKCMALRLKYLREINYSYVSEELVKLIENVEMLSLIIRNMILKYNLTMRSEILKKVITKIDQLEDIETNILSQLLINLNDTFPSKEFN